MYGKNYLKLYIYLLVKRHFNQPKIKREETLWNKSLTRHVVHDKFKLQTQNSNYKIRPTSSAIRHILRALS